MGILLNKSIKKELAQIELLYDYLPDGKKVEIITLGRAKNIFFRILLSIFILVSTYIPLVAIGFEGLRLLMILITLNITTALILIIGLSSQEMVYLVNYFFLKRVYYHDSSGERIKEPSKISPEKRSLLALERTKEDFCATIFS